MGESLRRVEFELISDDLRSRLWCSRGPYLGHTTRLEAREFEVNYFGPGRRAGRKALLLGSDFDLGELSVPGQRAALGILEFGYIREPALTGAWPEEIPGIPPFRALAPRTDQSCRTLYQIDQLLAVYPIVEHPLDRGDRRPGSPGVLAAGGRQIPHIFEDIASILATGTPGIGTLFASLGLRPA